MKEAEILRVADPADRALAFATREAVFVDEQGIPPSLEFDELDDVSEHLLAKVEGRAVGTLRFRQVDDATAKIERVAVLREARGRAVGRALLLSAVSQIKKRGLTEARLHAQTYALDFYAKLGFVAYGEVFDEDGIPHRAMRKRLDVDEPTTRHHKPTA